MGRPRRALTEEALHKEPAPLTRVLIVLLCGVGHAVNQLGGAIAGSVNVCRIAEIMNEEKRMRGRKGAGEKEGSRGEGRDGSRFHSSNKCMEILPCTRQ